MSHASRRDFIKFVGVYLFLQPQFAIAKKNLSSGTPSLENFLINNAPAGGYGSAEKVVVSPPGSVEIYNNISKRINKIDLLFFGHTLMQNPQKSNHFYTFEQFGKRGALLDIKNLAVVGTIEAEENNVFMGHSIYVPAKNVILTSEQNHETKKGEISVRDPITLKQLRKFSSNGLRPHDCHYIAETNSIAVINDFGPSNISYIDVESGKVQKEIFLDKQSKIKFNHFEISKDNWICAGARKPSPHVVLVNPEGKLLKLEHPPGISETGILSIAFLEHGDFVAVTYPESKMVAVWNYKKMENAGYVTLPTPKGILNLKSDAKSIKSNEVSFLVSLEFERGLKKLTVSKNKKLIVSPYETKFGGTGAHLVRANI